ncbi:M23 family metallopeptidase [Microbacterium sp. NPDC057944]|uniref:M23 family metallopeptidase n=1 Tax=Microbacterium sp. NPDC057944 TaxID=3346286 RepID=UPI0036D95378
MSRRTLIAAGGLAAGVALLGHELLTGDRANAAASAANGYIYPTDPFKASTEAAGQFNAPRDGGARRHMGLDTWGYRGMPILAIAGGRVAGGDWNSTSGDGHGWGHHVIIDHGNGVTSLYAHLDGPPAVGPTQTVLQGQLIGRMGNSQLGPTSGMGVHLHIEIKVNGSYVSPLAFLNNGIGPAPSPNPPGAGAVSIAGVKEFAVRSGSWSAIPVGYNMSNRFTAVNMGSGWGDLYGSFGGHLRYVGVMGGAWTQMDSGLPLDAYSISALNVGQSFPHIFAVENSVLYHIYADGTGWHKASTGLTVPGKISAVLLPGGNVQIVANIGGYMHHITTHNGWEIGNSGIPIGDEFKAVNVGGMLQIVTLLNGVVHLIWPGAGWQLQSTGIGTSGSLTAVDMGGGYPTVITNEGWSVCVTSVSGGGWVRQSTGVAVSGTIDALNIGGGYPTVYAV